MVCGDVRRHIFFDIYNFSRFDFLMKSNHIAKHYTAKRICGVIIYHGSFFSVKIVSLDTFRTLKIS